MRYLSIPTVSFTDAQGNTRSVKDFRQIPVYSIRSTINRGPADEMDYLAQRDDVFGRGHEGDAYQLWEANAVWIVEHNFDLSSLRRLQVPS